MLKLSSTVILLQIVMPTHLLENHESQLKKNESHIENACNGPLYNQTVNL